MTRSARLTTAVWSLLQAFLSAQRPGDDAANAAAGALGCLGCGTFLLIPVVLVLVKCASCGNMRLQASAKCPHCGNA